LLLLLLLLVPVVRGGHRPWTFYHTLILYYIISKCNKVLKELTVIIFWWQLWIWTQVVCPWRNSVQSRQVFFGHPLCLVNHQAL